MPLTQQKIRKLWLVARKANFSNKLGTIAKKNKKKLKIVKMKEEVERTGKEGQIQVD